MFFNFMYLLESQRGNIDNSAICYNDIADIIDVTVYSNGSVHVHF